MLAHSGTALRKGHGVQVHARRRSTRLKKGAALPGIRSRPRLQQLFVGAHAQRGVISGTTTRSRVAHHVLADGRQAGRAVDDHRVVGLATGFEQVLQPPGLPFLEPGQVAVQPGSTCRGRRAGCPGRRRRCWHRGADVLVPWRWPSPVVEPLGPGSTRWWRPGIQVHDQVRGEARAERAAARFTAVAVPAHPAL